MGHLEQHYGRYTHYDVGKIRMMQYGKEYSPSDLTALAKSNNLSHSIRTIKPGELPRHLPLSSVILNKKELEVILDLLRQNPSFPDVILAKNVGSVWNTVVEFVLDDRTDAKLLEMYPKMKRRKCQTIMIPSLLAQDALSGNLERLVKKRFFPVPTKSGYSILTPLYHFDWIADLTVSFNLGDCWSHYAPTPFGAINRGSS